MNPVTIDYSVTGGSHWLVLSNVLAKNAHEVLVYDSMYNNTSSSTDTLINLLYANNPGYKVIFAKVQRQQDTTSCGRWDIAFAFDLALGYDPEATKYDDT